MKNSPGRHDISAARLRGLISNETMASAVQGDARALAWTAHKIDGNDGPASPPEGWQAEVTAETLTDEQLNVLRQSLSRGHYAFQWTIDALASGLDRIHHPNRYRNARRECAALINARREGSK